MPWDPPVPPRALPAPLDWWLPAYFVLTGTSWEALMDFSEILLALEKQDFSVSHSTTCMPPLPAGSCRFFADVWFSTWWWLDTSRCDDNVPVLLLLIMTNCQTLSLFLVFPGQLISIAKAWKICHNTGQIKETSGECSYFWTFVDDRLFLKTFNFSL